MAQDKLDIKLKIAGKSYGMAIKPELEEYFRLAEKDINQYVAKLEATSTDGYSTQDYLAITALQLGVSRIRMAQNRELGEDVQRLKSLADLIDGCLE